MGVSGCVVGVSVVAAVLLSALWWAVCFVVGTTGVGELLALNITCCLHFPTPASPHVWTFVCHTHVCACPCVSILHAVTCCSATAPTPTPPLRRQ